MRHLYILDGITHLYVIHSTSGYFKIGISKNPNKRLKQLDRGALTPFVNTLFLTVALEDWKAPIIEKMFHKTYADKRVNGEWFALDAFDVRDLTALCEFINDRAAHEMWEKMNDV